MAKSDLNRQSLELERCRVIASDRGGRLVSNEYINDWEKLEWACQLGHRWLASPGKIKQGRWCPTCSTGISERIVRSFFEQTFQASFPRIRPTWLRSDRTGRPLELDGYCEQLQLAFEYDGVQHDEAVPKFGGAVTHERLRHHDALKTRRCAEEGVRLIRIPSLKTKLKLSDLGNFVRSECERLGVHVPVDASTLDLSPAFLTTDSVHRLEELRTIARSRGGQLLENVYVDSYTKMRWRCSAGHEWLATAGNLRNAKSWCRVCAGVDKKRIEEVREAGRSVGLELVSTEYKNAKSPLSWRCERGHACVETYRDVCRGRRCRACRSGERPTIKNLRARAAERGGECLSEEYLGATKHHLWKCHVQDHPAWTAAWASVQKGAWCRKCFEEKLRRKPYARTNIPRQACSQQLPHIR